MATNKGISVGDSLLKEKAKEFGQMLGICEGSSFMYSHRKPKKIVFSVRFRLNRHETENENENTKKPIYKTETETGKNEKKTKPKPKKGFFFENKFFKCGKKHYLCFFIQ
jgi:hypothetical protein